jgi:hypothetical protein
MPLSETFWISTTTLAAGLFTAVLGACYKSKCSDVQCFCIRFKRDVEAEVREDLVNIERGERNSTL